MKRKNPIDPVDAYVGERLRLARTLREMTQEKLGALSGVTFQQIQKYEKGSNRISVSRLVQLAVCLSMPLSWFFEKVPTRHINGADHVLFNAAPRTDMSLFYRRETEELLQVYYAIGDKGQRTFLKDIMLSLSVQKH
jgi:transcriptional regulator with XRE-family HTH domain